MGLVELIKIGIQMIMNIEKYSSFFHDGSIFEISHFKNNVIVSMGSAEVDKEDMEDSIVLSVDDRIRGKLHLEGVKSIKENAQPYAGILKMKYADAEIFHFEMHQGSVEFQIKWGSYPPKSCIEDFSTIEIKAEKIWWENIPDLEYNGS